MRPSLLDTDIVSEVLKGHNARVRAAASTYVSEFRAFNTSSITVMEVVQGLHLKNRDALSAKFFEFTRAANVISFDHAAAILAGQIAADLKLIGQPIGRADPMIAAIAIQHGLVLVSGNSDHFRRITELGYRLVLDNWRLFPDAG